MSRIFISHSSVNNTAALALSQWLEQEGWSDHFLDVDANRGLAPGERWQAALAAAVDRCEAIIFLISPAWRDSPWCLAEFHQARSLGKPIFGLLVEATPIASLRPEMTTEWQLCNLVDGEERARFSVGQPPVVPPTTIEFAQDGLKRLRVGLRRAGLDPLTFVWPPPQEQDRPPYPGLRALGEQDAAVFFGRDANIVRAIDQLRLIRQRGIERLLVILGASGAGKSSFLRAGLMPRIRRDTDHFLVLPVLRPERAAIYGRDGLLSCLRQACADASIPLSRADLSARLASSQGLSTLLQRLVVESRLPPSIAETTEQPTERTLVLPIDQGEELFTADGRSEARDLLDLIAALDREWRQGNHRDGGLRLLVVLTIRSDAVQLLQNDTVLCQLSPVFFSLPPMPRSEYKAVIEGPARRHSEAGHRLAISPELSERLIRDAEGADALPLLALTLEWLYREYAAGGEAVISLAEYEKLGGVSGAIELAVQRALARPEYPPAIPVDPVEQRRVLRKCFPALATVDPDTGEPKRLVAREDELLSAAPDALPFIDRLVEQHLLLRDRRSIEDLGETTIIEVAHEALLRHWDAMVQWLGEYTEALMAMEALHKAAREWSRKGRDPVLLVHTGHRLSAAEALRSHHLKDRLDEIDKAYLDAARQVVADRLHERERQLHEIDLQQQARARLQRIGKWGLGAVTVVLLAAATWIVTQTRAVSRQTSLVLTAAGERADEEKRFERGLRLGVLAAQESWLYPANPAAAPQLARAAAGHRLRLQVAAHSGTVVSASFSPDGKWLVTASSDDRTARVWVATTGEPVGKPLRHDAAIWHASFNPGSSRIVTASFDHTAQVWDAATGQRVGKVLKHGNTVSSASFSADGTRVLTASYDQTARVWDAETGEPLSEPLEHEGWRYFSPFSASFSPDGKRVVTASYDGTARIWDLESPQLAHRALTHFGPVQSASFSPDGRLVVTASSDQTARVWNVETGEQVGNELRHMHLIDSAQFSPDGKRIITASRDSTARIWDAETGQPVGEALKHEGSVSSAAFSPSGRHAVTVSADDTARVWNAQNGRQIGAALEHEGAILSARFAPDGRQVITASKDGTIRVWDAVISRAIQHGDGHIVSADFSADGLQVLTVSNDHVARSWDAETGGSVPNAVETGDEQRTFVGFSPDGKRVVSIALNKTVRVQDVETGKPVGKPLIHQDNVRSARFSPDGNRIVTASRDQTARVWSVTTGEPVGGPLSHDAPVWDASFSGDGKRIVTFAVNDAARVWDAETSQPVGAAFKHEGFGWLPVLSPDGKRVLTSSSEGSARIWDPESGKPFGVLLEHKEYISSAHFSPNGTRVVTASADGTARTWDAGTGKPVGEPLRHEAGVNEARFSPDGHSIVTVSDDGTARLWDVETGKPVSEPLEHEDSVQSARFNRQGDRFVTTSFYQPTRVWDVGWSGLARSTDLLQSVCESKLVGETKRLTQDDIDASPILAGRAGEDVCANIETTLPRRR